jgi:hypothetical protein
MVGLTLVVTSIALAEAVDARPGAVAGELALPEEACQLHVGERVRYLGQLALTAVAGAAGTALLAIGLTGVL